MKTHGDAMLLRTILGDFEFETLGYSDFLLSRCRSTVLAICRAVSFKTPLGCYCYITPTSYVVTSGAGVPMGTSVKEVPPCWVITSTSPWIVSSGALYCFFSFMFSCNFSLLSCESGKGSSAGCGVIAMFRKFAASSRSAVTVHSLSS